MVTLKARYLATFIGIVALRQKLMIAATIAIAVLVGAILSLSAVPRYQAKASMLLKFGREYVYRPEVGNSGAARNFSRTEEAINSEIQILNSDGLKRRVVERLGVKTLYPELVGGNGPDGFLPSLSDVKRWVRTSLDAMIKEPSTDDGGTRADSVIEKALRNFNRAYEVKAAQKSQVIHVFFKHKDRVLAERVLSVLIDSFTEMRLKIFSDAKPSFLEERLQQHLKGLRQAEMALRDYKTHNNIFQIDEQTRLLLSNANDLSRSHRAAENRIKELQAKLAVVTREMKSIPKEVSIHVDTKMDHVREAQRKLLNLRLQETALLADYTEDSDKVKNLRRDIEMVKAFLDEQKKDVVDIVRRGKSDLYRQLELEMFQLKADISSANAKKNSYAQQLGRIKTQIAQLELSRQRLNDLERNIRIREQNYRSIQQKVEEERTSAALDKERRTNIRVIQKPTAPLKSLGLTKTKKVMLSAVMGIMIGLTLAIVLEIRRGVYYDADSIADSLGVPVLAVFPSLQTRQHWADRIRHLSARVAQSMRLDRLRAFDPLAGLKRWQPMSRLIRLVHGS